MGLCLSSHMMLPIVMIRCTQMRDPFWHNTIATMLQSRMKIHNPPSFHESITCSFKKENENVQKSIASILFFPPFVLLQFLFVGNFYATRFCTQTLGLIDVVHWVGAVRSANMSNIRIQGCDEKLKCDEKSLNFWGWNKIFGPSYFSLQFRGR